LLAGVTSKPRCNENFDPRLDRVVKTVHDINNVNKSFNLDLYQEEIPVHEADGKRHPNKLIPNIKFTPFDFEPKRVVIVDDVLTTGSHFIAWKEVIKKIYPDIEVIGLFFAKAMHQFPPGDERNRMPI
jgi:pyrimidine operon attenuation protein/uracil phosphoribosyltransferase